MREAEPAAEVFRGLVRRSAVERHQRAGAARYFRDLRAPFVEADGRHLDPILAAMDGLLEEMHGYGLYGAHGKDVW